MTAVSDDPPSSTDPSAAPAVVEWGPGTTGRSARWRRALERLADPRLVRPLAGVGAALVLISLFGEWQIATWTLDRRIGLAEIPIEETTAVARDFASLGPWATGWLVGVVLLLVGTAMALFSDPPVRKHLRIGGLAAAAVQAVLLVAIAVDVQRSSWLSEFESLVLVGPEAPDPALSWGWGPYVAAGGLLLLAGGLWLSAPGSAGRADPAGWPAGEPGWPGNPPPAGHPALSPSHPPAAGQPPGGPPTGQSSAGSPTGQSPAGSPSVGPAPGHRPPAGSPTHSAAGSPPYSGPPDLAVGPTEPFAGPTEGHEWR